MKIFNFMKLMS